MLVKRFGAVLASLLVALSAMVLPAHAAMTEPVAAWVFESATLPVMATEGTLPASVFRRASSLSNVGYADGALYASGWNWTDSSNKYWEIEIPAVAHRDFTIIFQAWSSGAGPQNFLVEATTDGINWEEVGSYVLTLDAGTEYSIGFTPQIRAFDLLGIRLRASGATAVNGGTIESGGTSYIANVKVLGGLTGGTVSGLYDVLDDFASNLGGVYTFLPPEISVPIAAAFGIVFAWVIVQLAIRIVGMFL